jgi:hypothetical protein
VSTSFNEIVKVAENLIDEGNTYTEVESELLKKYKTLDCRLLEKIINVAFRNSI